MKKNLKLHDRRDHDLNDERNGREDSMRQRDSRLDGVGPYTEWTFLI